MRPIYLDCNASTPIPPEVATAMRPYLEEHFGNPSSSHWFGRQTKKAVERARVQVASMLGCESSEVVFTSGGTESNNYALAGVARTMKERGRHMITSAIEHPAVLNVMEHLKREGFTYTLLPVDATGLVSVTDVEKAITPETILISVMHANNEVGTVQPIPEIAALAKSRGILMHTDAAQSVGKLNVEVDALGVDLLSIAGHKIYAPKGIGALYIRKGTPLQKLIHGAGHEENRRAGTENVLEIVGLGQACEMIHQNLDKNAAHLLALRNRLRDGLMKAIEGLTIHGHSDLCLPNTLSVGFPRVEANALLAEAETIAASPGGAACHSGKVSISPVLTAMGVPKEVSLGTIRFSMGKMNTEEEIDRTVEILVSALKHMQG